MFLFGIVQRYYRTVSQDQNNDSPVRLNKATPNPITQSLWNTYATLFFGSRNGYRRSEEKV